MENETRIKLKEAVHKDSISATVIRYVEIESLSSEFQDLVNSGRCYGLFEIDGVLFMNDNDGNVYEQKQEKN